MTKKKSSPCVTEAATLQYVFWNTLVIIVFESFILLSHLISAYLRLWIVSVSSALTLRTSEQHFKLRFSDCTTQDKTGGGGGGGGTGGGRLLCFIAAIPEIWLQRAAMAPMSGYLWLWYHNRVTHSKLYPAQDSQAKNTNNNRVLKTHHIVSAMVVSLLLVLVLSCSWSPCGRRGRARPRLPRRSRPTPLTFASWNKQTLLSSAQKQLYSKVKLQSGPENSCEICF